MYFYSPSDLPERQLFPGITARVASGERGHGGQHSAGGFERGAFGFSGPAEARTANDPLAGI